MAQKCHYRKQKFEFICETSPKGLEVPRTTRYFTNGVRPDFVLLNIGRKTSYYSNVVCFILSFI